MANIAIALIWENDKFLIYHNPNKKDSDEIWEFAGGKVEANETKEQALIRGCQEKLGIDIFVGEIIFDAQYVDLDTEINMTLFNATIDGGTQQLYQCENICWISTDEIPKFKFCPEYTVIMNKLGRVKKYGKLVRDFIPDIIANAGKTCVTKILSDEAYEKMLEAKLDEELKEYHEENNIEELADLMEVIYACAAVHGYSIDDLEKVRREKAAKRGEFKEKIFLEEVFEK